MKRHIISDEELARLHEDRAAPTETVVLSGNGYEGRKRLVERREKDESTFIVTGGRQPQYFATLNLAVERYNEL